MVLLEDVTHEDFSESLESWVVLPEQRKLLNVLNQLYSYDLEDYTEEVMGIGTNKFSNIRSSLLKRLEKIENEIKPSLRLRL